jgi:hypothetical protein
MRKKKEKKREKLVAGKLKVVRIPSRKLKVYDPLESKEEGGEKGRRTQENKTRTGRSCDMFGCSQATIQRFFRLVGVSI